MKKLGRIPHDPAMLARLPQAGLHLDAVLPDAPPVVDWSRDVAPQAWGMCLNDAIGDCTCAAVAHAIVAWSAITSSFQAKPYWTPSDADVLALYRAVSGYVPGQLETDQGARCADVLALWQRQGVECAGTLDKLAAYATIDPRNHAHLRAAVWSFGCVYAGVMLHQAQMTEAVWSDLSSQVRGGHCVLLVGADDTGPLCVTWGELRRMTWAWWDAATDEAYALLSDRWMHSNRAPPGFKLTALLEDMRAMTD